MEPIRIGVIGVGHMGQYHVNILSGINEVDLIGIHDINSQTAQMISNKYAVPDFTNLDDLLNKVDAITIAVPTHLHFELSHYCLTQKKHILLEKPMTTNVEEGKELVELALKNKLILQVGHVERFNGAVQELKNIVSDPYLIEARRLAPQIDRIQDVGVVWDIMIHDIDIIMHLLNTNVKSISAKGKRVYSDFEDVAVADIQFENGCIAHLTASRVTQEKIRTMEITQKDSYIYLDYLTQDINIHKRPQVNYKVRQDEIAYRQESLIERVFIHKENPLKQEILHFINCINGKESPFVNGTNDIQIIYIAKEIINQIQSSF